MAKTPKKSQVPQVLQGDVGHAILVYETQPEDVHLYLLPPDVVQKYLPALQDAQGRILGCSPDSDGLLTLSTAVRSEYPDKGYEEHLGVFIPYRIQGPALLVGVKVTHVFRSGLAL